MLNVSCFSSFGIVATKILFLCKQRTYDDKFKLARIIQQGRLWIICYTGKVKVARIERNGKSDSILFGVYSATI